MIRLRVKFRVKGLDEEWVTHNLPDVEPPPQVQTSLLLTSYTRVQKQNANR